MTLNEAIVHATAKTLTRAVVDLPFALLLIRVWVWGGVWEMFDMPTPNWRQTWGIALLILCVT